jgi:hypothetical protein
MLSEKLAGILRVVVVGLIGPRLAVAPRLLQYIDDDIFKRPIFDLFRPTCKIKWVDES